MLERVRMKSAIFLVLTVCGVLAEDLLIQRVHQCRANCLEGVKCRKRIHVSSSPCNKHVPSNSTSIHNVSVSTVMLCEKTRNCSLALKVAAAVRVTEQTWGVTICVLSTGMLQVCKAFTIPREARQKLIGRQVSVQDDCFPVRPGQNVQVTVRTVSSYCDPTWSQAYRVQECDNRDLRENVPECITGRIVYSIHAARRELSVSVSGALEDRDYHLRMCLKGYVCTSTNQHVRLKKENPLNATFQYSRALPCLCIEGWSSKEDARRVQVCPFRNNTGELWSGLTFDLEQEVLSWEPACPVKVVVSLCQSEGDNVCHDLANSTQIVSSQKLEYSKVDPHPKLCVKFSTDAGTWIKCPFSKENFPAWDLAFSSVAGEQKAVVSSHVSAKLSLRLCHQSRPSTCHDVISVPVEKLQSVDISLGADVCHPDMCVQVTREDVKFSTHILHCNFQCSNQEQSNHETVPWIPLAIACSVLLILTLLTGVAMIKALHPTAISKAGYHMDDCIVTTKLRNKNSPPPI